MDEDTVVGKFKRLKLRRTTTQGSNVSKLFRFRTVIHSSRTNREGSKWILSYINFQFSTRKNYSLAGCRKLDEIDRKAR